MTLGSLRGPKKQIPEVTGYLLVKSSTETCYIMILNVLTELDGIQEELKFLPLTDTVEVVTDLISGHRYKKKIRDIRFVDAITLTNF